MVVGFTTTCAISDYHHYSYEFEPRSWRGVLDTTLCDKVCLWLATGRWFSPVSSTNKTDLHDIAEILLKVALDTISQHQPNLFYFLLSLYILTIYTNVQKHVNYVIQIKRYFRAWGSIKCGLIIVLVHLNEIWVQGNNKITELRTILQRGSQNS